MKVSGILLFILILSGFFGSRCEATVYHSNGTSASVQSIHSNQAQNGDTITLPAGTFTWTTRVTITKAITLQGAGVGNTIIKDAVQNGQLIQWTLAAGYTSRLTGIEFQDGGRLNFTGAPVGIIHIDGSNTDGSQLRFDHNKITNLNGASMVLDTVIGVLDHNEIITTNGHVAIYPYGSRWNGGTQGDGSWAAPANYGSSQFLFMEDNTFDPSTTDSFAGARFVLRHNNILNGWVYAHGTESTGRTRGCRAIEVYNNIFTGSNTNRFLGTVRSGGVLFHDNSVSGYWGDSGEFTLTNFRSFHRFNPWGGADGTNIWDANEPTASFTGTAAANSSGTTVTVSGASWTTNQWAGYTIRRTSDVCNSGSLNFSWIQSNTSNKIFYVGNALYPGESNTSFCAGDSLEIRKVDHALDQPGRAGGTLITGNPPVRPPGWNNQVTEPCYSWNNINELGHHVNFAGDPGVRANEHYFNNTPMPGYTPYVYPHPLVTAFDSDGYPDYLLYNSATQQTAIWYLKNSVRVGSVSGPTVPGGWQVVAADDFNRDGHPDYVLFNPTTGETVIWYMNNGVHVSGAHGPTLPAGWTLGGVADFNGDGKPDYLLLNPVTLQTVIWYMNNNVHVTGAYGPTLLAGWNLAGVADFNGDGKPDYLLLNPVTLQTVIWYMNNNVHVTGAYGPTLPAGWSLIAP